jgi:hypothetical protein
MSAEATQPAAAPETQTPVQGQPAPALPTAAPPAATSQPEPKPKAVVEIPSDEFKRRLDETRTKAENDAKAALLKSLGVTDEGALKTAVEQYRKLEDEKRSDLEKRDARIKDLEPKAQRADALEQVVKRQVDVGLAGLSEAQREGVKRLAGDDPLRQLEAIEVFRNALPPAPLAPPALPIPPAANTAAPPAPPPAGTSTPHVDHLATYQALQKSNPMRAAHYYLTNNAAIVAAQKARG